MSLASVTASPDVEAIRPYFLDRVLAGDLHRYFLLIPGCSDEWWGLLAAGVRELWGDRSLVHSGLPPVHRLTGWLVEQGRRDGRRRGDGVRRRAGRGARAAGQHRGRASGSTYRASTRRPSTPPRSRCATPRSERALLPSEGGAG